MTGAQLVEWLMGENYLVEKHIDLENGRRQACDGGGNMDGKHYDFKLEWRELILNFCFATTKPKGLWTK